MNVSSFFGRQIGLAMLIASLFVMLPSQSASASHRHYKKAGIDRPASVISADLDKMFPCTLKLRECAWSINILSDKPSSLIDTIEARPEIARAKGARMIRIEPNPMYGKLLLYLFPSWKNADRWLANSLEITRHRGCPKIAHIGNAWVVVRGEFIEVLGYMRTELTVTRHASEIESWRRLDEEACEGPRVIEEIR